MNYNALKSAAAFKFRARAYAKVNLYAHDTCGSRNVNSVDAEGKAVVLEGEAVTFDALGRAVEAATSGGIEFIYGPD